MAGGGHSRGVLRRVMASEEASEYVGETVPELEPTVMLREAGLWSDADTGEPVLAILPCPELQTLREAALVGDSATAMGTLRTGTGNRNQSVTFGYRPRKPSMLQEDCRLTAFDRDHPEASAFLSHYSSVLSEQLGDAFPEVEVMGREVAEQVLPDWRLDDDSLWTSGVINSASALPYHRDGNNFDAWSVMPVLRYGVSGGHLNIPEYDVTVPCRDGYSVAFFGKRLVHGVTPMRKRRGDGYRVSIVYYALQGLKDCHTYAEETRYGRKRRTEREADIARRRAAGVESPIEKKRRPDGERVSPGRDTTVSG